MKKSKCPLQKHIKKKPSSKFKMYRQYWTSAHEDHYTKWVWNPRWCEKVEEHRQHQLSGIKTCDLGFSHTADAAILFQITRTFNLMLAWISLKTDFKDILWGSIAFELFSSKWLHFRFSWRVWPRSCFRQWSSNLPWSMV